MENNRIKKNVASDSLKLSIAQLLSLTFSLICVMLLSRYRTVEEYGTYSQMITICAIVATFFSSGFSQCINYFLANEENCATKAKFIKTYYAILTVAGTAGGLIAFGLIPFFVDYYHNDALWQFPFFLLIYPLAKILNDGADRFFILYHKTNQLILFKIRYGVTTLLTVIVALVFHWTFKSYMVAFTVVEGIFGVLIYYFIYKITNVIPFGFHKETCKMIVSFAIPMGIAALISVINKELDKIVVGGLTDTATLAIFTNAAKELPIVVFSSAISTVVMPFVVQNIQKNKRHEAVSIWKTSIKLASLIMCFFLVAFFVFAPNVISVLYSDKYLDGTHIFRIYLLTELFRLTYYGMVLNAEKKTKLILFSSIATMVLNIILDYALYMLIGLAGPALATVLSVAIMNIFQLLLTKKHLNVRFNDIYPVWYITKVLSLNCILGIAFYGIQKFLFKSVSFDQNAMTIALGCVWSIIYFLIVRKQVCFLWKQLNS